MSDVVNKLWNFCHTLKHDGIDYANYVEQITYLLFLKMADEKGLDLPKGCDWATLRQKSGPDLKEHYEDTLKKLAKQPGILGDIFASSVSLFREPVNLKRLVQMIDETEWTSLGVDVKAAAFEGLLEKAASEGKKGAGQYFTPRVLIRTIVDVMKPDPRASSDFKVADPACGTGGFLWVAYDWFLDQTKGAVDRDLAKRLKTKTYFGTELVLRPRRLALMNMVLHGIEPQIALKDTIYEAFDGTRFDVVLTNPPFGTRGANSVPEREDFDVDTANKQLNFIQHVMTVLKDGGRAAVVVPDNCLFEDKAAEVMKILVEECDLHTVLRLPNGTFAPYTGAKTNVLFFRKGLPTEKLWIYDARSGVATVTKKDRKLSPKHFEEFVACYGDDPNGKSKRSDKQSKEDRWRSFSIAEVKAKGFKLDELKWLKSDDVDDVDIGDPQEVAERIEAELGRALVEIRALMAELEKDEAPVREAAE